MPTLKEQIKAVRDEFLPLIAAEFGKEIRAACDERSLTPMQRAFVAGFITHSIRERLITSGNAVTNVLVGALNTPEYFGYLATAAGIESLSVREASLDMKLDAAREIAWRAFDREKKLWFAFLGVEPDGAAGVWAPVITVLSASMHNEICGAFKKPSDTAQPESPAEAEAVEAVSASPEVEAVAAKQPDDVPVPETSAA